MDRSIDRRRALTALGVLGAGGLLAGCGGDDDGGGAATTIARDATVPTGTSSTGTSSTGPGSPAGGLAGRFEDAASCSVSPELTAGPYYLDVDAIRREIREDREGTRLRVGVRILDADCRPIPDAVVEIWHCDARGSYSGFEAASEAAERGGVPEGVGGVPSAPDDTRYLRGGQVTDAEGIVEFVTIYPGWYPGRTVHIHARVLLGNREALTTQLFFDEGVTDEVYRSEPYASETGRTSFNHNDAIFAEGLILTTSEERDGYLGLISLIVAR